jgi:hypothetical protein
VETTKIIAMKKLLLSLLCIGVCLTSCVDKQKKFKEITDEMNLNTSAVYFTTVSLLSKMSPDDNSSNVKMFKTLSNNGVCERISSIIEKDNKLFESAADLNINIEQLNHLKGVNDCCKVVWGYIKSTHTEYMDDMYSQMKSATELINKTQNEFPKIDTDKMMKISYGILGN